MKVYLNDYIDPQARNRLEKYVEITDSFEHPEELDAIIVRQQFCNRDVISRASKCRLIQQHGTGLDRIDLEAAAEFNIPVRNTPGINAESVAEYTIMMMLSLSRKANYIDSRTRKGKLITFGLPETIGHEMYGKKLGIVGTGNIAKRVAQIAKSGFNMQVYCYSDRKSEIEIHRMGLIPSITLESLFEECDYISLHNLLTNETYHMINEDTFKHSKPGQIFINTARGGLVDEEALYNALKSGKLAAAGLDVFEQQPPKTDNPLMSMDNFMAGMHVAGSTYEALERNGRAVVDSVLEFLNIYE